MKSKKWITLSWVLLLASTAAWAQSSHRVQMHKVPEFVWRQSLPLPWADPRIFPIGGTELRTLVAFDNKLFAGNAYWMDTEKDNPKLPGAQVLRLDSPTSPWQVDLELCDRKPNAVRMYFRISTLEKVRFATDGAGRPLAAPVELLLASALKRGKGLDAFSRGAGSGWSAIPIPGQENAPPNSDIRAFACHKDQISGVDYVFAGATGAIFAGTYDPTHHKIVWNPQSEWQKELTGLDWQADHPDDPSTRGRVASFADCNGKLYATSGGTMYERQDGHSPSWKKVFETVVNLQNPRVTGLRGLTCVADPSEPGDVLFVGVEDNPSRIYRIDPRQIGADGMYDATLDLDVSSFLTKALGTKTNYVNPAYNKMTEYPDPAGGCSHLLLGLEAVTPQYPKTFGEQHYNPYGYYLVRDCNGNYALREIRDAQITPPPMLVAVRTIAVSPFPSDPPGTVYAAGFDPNHNPVHNTAWIYKGVPAQ